MSNAYKGFYKRRYKYKILYKVISVEVMCKLSTFASFLNNVNVKVSVIKVLIRECYFCLTFVKGSWLIWQVDKVYFFKGF